MHLVIRELSKRYANSIQALDRVSLTIPPGMYGLLGPNGAGKSTLMRTLATLQGADSGSATLGDIDILREPAEVHALLGYLPQDAHMKTLRGAGNRCRHATLGVALCAALSACGEYWGARSTAVVHRVRASDCVPTPPCAECCASRA